MKRFGAIDDRCAQLANLITTGTAGPVHRKLSLTLVVVDVETLGGLTDDTVLASSNNDSRIVGDPDRFGIANPKTFEPAKSKALAAAASSAVPAFSCLR